MGYGWDISDGYRLEIPHGKEMVINLTSNKPIFMDIPYHESCNSNEAEIVSSNRISFPAGNHHVVCEINSSSNTIDILLSHWDWENEENKSKMTNTL